MPTRWHTLRMACRGVTRILFFTEAVSNSQQFYTDTTVSVVSCECVAAIAKRTVESVDCALCKSEPAGCDHVKMHSILTAPAFRPLPVLGLLDLPDPFPSTNCTFSTRAHKGKGLGT